MTYRDLKKKDNKCGSCKCDDTVISDNKAVLNLIYSQLNTLVIVLVFIAFVLSMQYILLFIAFIIFITYDAIQFKKLKKKLLKKD